MKTNYSNYITNTQGNKSICYYNSELEVYLSIGFNGYYYAKVINNYGKSSFLEFTTKQEKDQYIKDNNLIKMEV